MMRRASVVLVSITALLMALAAAADASLPEPRGGQPPPPAARAAGFAAPQRHSTFTLDPSPGDLELLEVEFPRQRRQSISAASLGFSVRGPFGDDYLAVSTQRRRPHGDLLALALVVNRPSALEDPASVRLVLRSSRVLGAPHALRLQNPFTSAASPKVLGKVSADLPCQVPRAGASMQASDLRVVGPGRGVALTGFGASAAVADAFDALCGLAYPTAFKTAVHGQAPAGPEPTPVPPTPEPPRCPPCNPKPGFACPLETRPAICPAAAPAARRPAAPASH